MEYKMGVKGPFIVDVMQIGSKIDSPPCCYLMRAPNYIFS